MSELTAIAESLEKLSASASSAYKYGPFFFAIPLILMPFIARAVFKDFFGANSAKPHFKEAYRDFRFYARSTIVAGLLCVGVGVAWWVFENYAFDKKTHELLPKLQQELEDLKAANLEKQYAVVGAILSGVKEDAELTPFVGQDEVYFSRIPATNTLYFTILSDEKIPKDFEVNAYYAELDRLKRARIPDPPQPLQIKIKLSERRGLGIYRFMHDPTTGRASIVPAPAPPSVSLR